MEVAKAELKLDKSSRKAQAGVVKRALTGALIVAAPAALLATLLSLAALLLTPTYEPSAQVSVDFQSQDGRRMYLAGGNTLQVEERQMLTDQAMRAAASRTVAEETIRRLGLEASPEELLNNLRVEQSGNTNVVILAYEGTDRREATRIANTLGKVTSKSVLDREAAGRKAAASVHEAAVPEARPEPQPLRNGLFTFALVWVVCAGAPLALLAILPR